MEMSGKVAVITGGTSGIGRSTAEKLLERGAAVLILGRDRERGAEMERLGDCHFYPCDMACPEEIAKTCDAILRDYPEIDILVNNAGMSIDGTVETLSLEEWNRIFAVNVTSVYLMSKHLIPAIRRRGGGHIINIASTAGTVGAPGLDAYASTKGAVIQLTRSMAADYAAEGDTGQRGLPRRDPYTSDVRDRGQRQPGRLRQPLPHQEAGPAGGDCRHDRISGQRRGQLYGGEHRLGGRRIYLHLRAEKPPGETGAHALHTEEGGAPSFSAPERK